MVDKGKTTIVKSELQLEGQAPAGIDFAAVIAKRREKAVAEDEDRARMLLKHPERFARPRVRKRA